MRTTQKNPRSFQSTSSTSTSSTMVNVSDTRPQNTNGNTNSEEFKTPIQPPKRVNFANSTNELIHTILSATSATIPVVDANKMADAVNESKPQSSKLDDIHIAFQPSEHKNYLIITLPPRDYLPLLKKVLYKTLPLIYKKTDWDNPAEIKANLEKFVRITTLLMIVGGEQRTSSITYLMRLHDIAQPHDYHFQTCDTLKGLSRPLLTTGELPKLSTNQLIFATSETLSLPSAWIPTITDYLSQLLQAPHFHDDTFQRNALLLGSARTDSSKTIKELDDQYSPVLQEAQTFLLDDNPELSEEQIDQLTKKLKSVFPDTTITDDVVSLLKNKTNDCDACKKIQLAITANILHLEKPNTDKRYSQQFLNGLKLILSISEQNADFLTGEVLYELFLIMLTTVQPIRIRSTYFYEAVLDFFEQQWFNPLNPDKRKNIINSLSNKHPTEYDEHVTWSDQYLKSLVPTLLLDPILAGEVSINEAYALFQHFNLGHLQTIQIELAIHSYYTVIMNHSMNEGALRTWRTEYSYWYNNNDSLLPRTTINQYKDHFINYFHTFVDSEAPKSTIEGHFLKPFYLMDFTMIFAKYQEQQSRTGYRLG